MALRSPLAGLSFCRATPDLSTSPLRDVGIVSWGPDTSSCTGKQPQQYQQYRQEGWSHCGCSALQCSGTSANPPVTFHRFIRDILQGCWAVAGRWPRGFLWAGRAAGCWGVLAAYQPRVPDLNSQEPGCCTRVPAPGLWGLGWLLQMIPRGWCTCWRSRCTPRSWCPP